MPGKDRQVARPPEVQREMADRSISTRASDHPVKSDREETLDGRLHQTRIQRAPFGRFRRKQNHTARRIAQKRIPKARPDTVKSGRRLNRRFQC